MLKKIFFAAVLLTAASVYAADGINVVDGDSLEVGNERLRLMNIDAPEFFQKWNNPAPSRCWSADRTHNILFYPP